MKILILLMVLLVASASFAGEKSKIKKPDPIKRGEVKVPKHVERKSIAEELEKQQEAHRKKAFKKVDKSKRK